MSEVESINSKSRSGDNSFSWLVILSSFALGFALALLGTGFLFDESEKKWGLSSEGFADLNSSIIYQSVLESKRSLDSEIYGALSYLEASVDKNPFGKEYYVKAQKLQSLSLEFENRMNYLSTRVISSAKGPIVVDADYKALIRDFEKEILQVFDNSELEMGRARIANSAFFRTGKISDRNVDNMDAFNLLVYLEKVKSDVKITVLQGIYQLGKMVSKDEIIFDQFDLVIVPSATKVSIGEKFEAQVFLGASSSAMIPAVSINGIGYTWENGHALHQKTSNKVGKNTVHARIAFRDGFGKEQTLKKTFEYEVTP